MRLILRLLAARGHLDLLLYLQTALFTAFAPAAPPALAAPAPAPVAAAAPVTPLWASPTFHLQNDSVSQGSRGKRRRKIGRGVPPSGRKGRSAFGAEGEKTSTGTGTGGGTRAHPCSVRTIRGVIAICVEEGGQLLDLGRSLRDDESVASTHRDSHAQGQQQSLVNSVGEYSSSSDGRVTLVLRDRYSSSHRPSSNFGLGLGFGSDSDDRLRFGRLGDRFHHFWM